VTRNRGQFKRGVSGNPNGRPPKIRHDAADPAGAVSPPRSVTAQQIRQDSWTNPITGHGTNRDARTSTGFSIDVVTDLEAIALRRSEFLCKRIVEALPEYALRRGWTMKAEDKDLAEKIHADTEESGLGFDEMLISAAQKEREAGGAAIMPVIDGAQGDLSTPLDEGAIGRITALHLFEPRELWPLEWYTDLGNPKWSRPSIYQFTPFASGRVSYLGMQPIHESRLIIFPGARVTRQTQPGQRESWGDSALTPVKRVLSDFGISWGSAATLLQKHGKETYEVDGLANMLRQKDGLEEFDRHVAAMELAWSTLRMNVIDAKSRVSRATGTLAGVHEMLAEFKELVASAAETPVSIMFGTAGAGLRTGKDDQDSWHETVERYRTKRIRRPHEQLLRLFLLSGAGPTGGIEPKMWSIEYPPLSSPNEKEHADRLYTDMQRAQLAIASGVASADDVAESFYGGDTYSGDIVIDWQRREAQKKIDEEAAAQLQQDQAAMDALGRAPDRAQLPPGRAPKALPPGDPKAA
jgi:phage-related protein (TIGR01555 family)